MPDAKRTLAERVEALEAQIVAERKARAEAFLSSTGALEVLAKDMREAVNDLRQQVVRLTAHYTDVVADEIYKGMTEEGLDELCEWLEQQEQNDGHRNNTEDIVKEAQMRPPMVIEPDPIDLENQQRIAELKQENAFLKERIEILEKHNVLDDAEMPLVQRQKKETRSDTDG